MKISMTMEGDELEDTQHFISLLRVNEYLSMIYSVQELIRARVKHGRISDDELEFLVRIREELFIEE